jgi:hypothetical protein
MPGRWSCLARETVRSGYWCSSSTTLTFAPEDFRDHDAEWRFSACVSMNVAVAFDKSDDLYRVGLCVRMPARSAIDRGLRWTGFGQFRTFAG